MKIATWNVNSIRTRLAQVIDWLKQNPVDVLCLQETKVIDVDFPHLPFEQLGYHPYFFGQKAYNGVALISRQPLTDVTKGFTAILPEVPPVWDEQKRVISGVIDGVRLVNLYVPNGSAVGSEKYIYKLGWLKILGEYLQELLQSSSGICVCGDFNIALEDKDIHDQVQVENHIMASPAERQALEEILALGFADAFRKFTLDGGHYSWWDLTPNLYELAQSCIIDVTPRKLTQPSDHTPVIVEF
jgi:exodeoxyribonuclease-3